MSAAAKRAGTATALGSAPGSAPESTPGGPADGARASWQPLLGSVLLGALWVVCLVALREVFVGGAWTAQALSAVGAVVLVSGAALTLRPGRRLAAWAIGVASGAALLAWAMLRDGRLSQWSREPLRLVQETQLAVSEGVPPVELSGALLDVVLSVWFAALALSALLLIGLGRYFASGLVPAVLMLAPVTVTSLRIPGPLLLWTGALLLLLLWVGAPRTVARWRGVAMSAVALALAAGLVAALPPVPDRVWNSAAVSVSPVSSGMPDVTLALARDLRERSSTVAFEYRGSTDGGSGNGTARFTLAVLSDFERGIWLPEDALDPGGASVDAPRPIASSAPASARPLGGESVVAIRVKGLLSSWLPMPSRAERIEAIGGSFDPEQWMWGDGTATARSDTALTRPGDRFRVLLADPPVLDGSGNSAPLPSAEAPADPERYLALPEDLPDAIADAARGATASLDPESSASPDADAYRTLSAASRLEGWFRSGEFVYDERAPYEPGADLDDPYAVMSAFLEQRSGYCVHFASTYAVMARSLGLPSRVAVGYVSRPSSPAGWTAVRARELHAWPEVHVDGVGWVAFEPTPGGAGYRAETGRPDPAESAAGDSPAALGQLPTPEAGADEPPSDAEQTEETEEAGGDEPGRSRGSSAALPSPGLVLGGVGLVVVLVCAAPAVRRTRRGVRRRRVARGERPAAHAWAELVDTAVDLGVYAPESARVRARTPEAVAEYLVSRGLRGDAAAAALGLARALVEERYAAAPAPAREAGPLRSELELATAALRSTAGWPARLRAALLPRSVLCR